jgi:phosphatidylglycerol lysyltransferase
MAAGASEIPRPPGARGAERHGPARRVVALAVRALLLALVLWLVWRELRGIDLQAAKERVQGAHAAWILPALGAAILGIAAMGLYDVLAYPGAPRLRARTRWTLGMLCFAWTNFLTLGPVGGPALRLFLYRRAGLDPGAIVRGLARSYCGMGGGLAAWMLVSLLPLGYGPATVAARCALVLALAPTLAILAGVIAGRVRPVIVGRPGGRALRLYAGLGLVGALDWTASLACFGLCGRALHVGVAFTDQIRAYFTGHLAGWASMMPGGIGSADAVWLKMLSINGLDPSVAAALIFLFRLVFYIVPWLVSLVGLYIFFAGRTDALMRWQRRLLAAAVAFNAAFLLASAATPAARDRLHVLNKIVPLDALEASHAVAVVAAALMLFLVRGILRGYRAAFIVTGTLLLVSSLAHTLKGGDVEEALVSLGMLTLLLGSRRAFTRPGRIPVGWELTLAAALGSLAFFVLVGLAAFRRVPYDPDLWVRFGFHADPSRFLRGAALVACVGLVFLVRQAVLPRHRPAAPSAEEIDAAVRIIERSERPTALNVAAGDKGVWFWRPDRSPGAAAQGVAAYQERHGKMVVFSDPAVDERRIDALLDDLHAFADERDVDLVFYQVTGAFMQHLHDYGYTFFKLGEEAVVPLAGFSLAGGASHGYRKTLRRVEGEGVTFEVLAPPHAPAIIDECRAVSDEWLAARGVQEMQFSLGYFSPAYLQRFPLAVARDGAGRLVAFLNILASRPAARVQLGKAGQPTRGAAGSGEAPGPSGELTFDLMRYRAGIESLMDFMVLKLMLWGAEQGYERLNLGMSPLFDVGESRRAALPERLARLLFEHGEKIYNYRGLHAFKDKFRPVWEPRFLAYQRPWDWPAAVFTTTSLIWGRGKADRERIARAREG